MKLFQTVLFTRLTLLLIAVAAAAVITCGGEKSAVQAPVTGTSAILADGEIATSTPLPKIPPPDAVPDGLEPVWEAYTIMVREYVERNKVDPAKLTEGAIKGMIQALGDAHTAYIDPADMKVEQSGFQGEFDGIGAHVEQSKDGRHIIIIAPIEGSPAERAGVKSGDIILAVDGVDAEGWSVVEGVNKIRGRKGTTVELKLDRIGESLPITVKIVRGTIETPSVRSRMLEDEKYGVVKISTFTARTYEETRAAMDKLVKDGAKGIVIDLRQNPGGLLTAVVDIASDFLKDGLVTYEVDGRGNRTDWPVKKGGKYQDIPVVILVDAFSASGSEVLSGALQDHGRAIVIGTTTFGKGSVNFLRELSNGGGLYLTVARWYTPNGRALEGKGVTPDVTVDFPEGASAKTITEDIQMSAAIKQLNFQTGQTIAATPAK